VFRLYVLGLPDVTYYDESEMAATEQSFTVATASFSRPSLQLG